KLPGGDITWSPRDKSGPFTDHIDVPQDALDAGSHHGATFYQLSDFHAALKGATKPLIDAEDGYRSVVIGAAAQESIATGLPVTIAFADEN
ncbi:MAG: gfo/Idh/MocA family oxidoreductase, partial [Erythrobacter sp.]